MLDVMENENVPFRIGRLQCSRELGELFSALAVAQSKMTAATKDSKNPHFKSTYADLASVWDALRPHLGPQGIAVVQAPYTEEVNSRLWTGVQTILGHKSGQYISGELSLPTAKGDPQGCGSAVTYGRRYSLAGFSGLTQDDDDGNGASIPPERIKSGVYKATAADKKALWQMIIARNPRATKEDAEAISNNFLDKDWALIAREIEGKK